MNKKKTLVSRGTRKANKAKKFMSPMEVGLALLAVIACIAAGVNFAILRNKQVEHDRETDKIYQRIKMHEAEMTSEKLEIARRVGRFEMKYQLAQANSIMRERPHYVVEHVNPIARPIAHSGEMEREFPNLYLEEAFATLADPKVSD